MKIQMKLKSLKEYTNEELILFLNRNQVTCLSELSGIVSEILRRMNEIKPLFPNEKESDWGNPLIP